MQPNYVVKKSVVPALSVWLILFFWLIVPLVIQIVRILAAKSYSVEFYDTKVVTKSGIFNKQEKQCVFAGVNSVSLSQGLLGQMFGYGDVKVDCRGKWDVDTYGIRDPRGLKNFLESKITTDNMTTVITD